MIELGIDVSSKSTGWAILDGKTVIKDGLIRNPTTQPNGEYLNRVQDHVHHIILTHGVEVVIMEDLFIQFLKVAKKLHPIHGVIKSTVYRALQKEPYLYPQQTWRSKLGIKNLTKKEREALLPEAKRVKGDKHVTYHKYLCDVKHRVVAYVNSQLKTEYTFEDNDITDAIGVILGHRKAK